jgi:hypothetical protein
MNSDIYRLVTVKDGKSDTAAIAQVFSGMSTGRLVLDLQLLNYYHEVPVSYGASLISVADDCVELKVHEHQAVIMKQHKSTIVKSRHFQNELGVHCYASYVNVPKKTVVLQNFAFAQIRAERREAVRVSVNSAIATTFSYQEVAFVGTMVDISGNGISISTGVVPPTSIGQAGHLAFTLSGMPLAVPGSLVKTIDKGADGCVCVFQMKPNRTSDNLIGQFIYQRQVEIIQELRDGFVED